MVRRICLDSDVLINLLNGEARSRQLLESLDADFYTTAVNSFEVWFGRRKMETVFEFLEALHNLHLDDSAARLAADMQRSLQAQGKTVDLRDLFIAAICITQSVELLTHNQKHFEWLKEFGLILV